MIVGFKDFQATTTYFIFLGTVSTYFIFPFVFYQTYKVKFINALPNNKLILHFALLHNKLKNITSTIKFLF